MGGAGGAVGVLVVVGASVALVAAALLVGTAMRLVLRPGSPPSLGTTAGLGAAAAAVVVALSFRATATTRPALGLLVAASLVVVAVAVVRRSRQRGVRATARSALASLGGRTELVAVGLVVLVLLPVLLLGPTWWSLGSNDLHRYVGSVQVWTSGEGGARDFAAVQTGPYLDGHEQRALSEKPMATALMVASSSATGLAPYQVPGPVMLLLLLVTASSLLVLLVRQWRVPLPLAGCAVAATTLSVVPMVRVLEAQPGQVAAVAWLALALALVAGSARRPLGSALAAALALAAATGANPSVVAGFSPLWAATAVWAASAAGVRLRTTVRVLLGAAGGAVVLVAAFVPWFLESWRLQGGGSEGHDVPFVSPLALVGLQPGTDPRLPAWTTWAAWALLATALVALAVGGRLRTGRASRPGLAVAVVALVSAVALVAVYGADNYVVHKWIAVLVALVMPLALARGFQRLAASDVATPTIRRAVPAAVAAGALAFSVASAASIPHVGSDDLLALADDPRLAALPLLNVDVDDHLEHSMLPLVVPAGSVVVVRPTYDDAAPPADAPSLVRTTQLAVGAWTDVVRLDSTYSLARRDLATGTERVTAADLRSQRLLHADWYVVGDDLRTTSSVAWLVAVARSGGDLALRLEGLTAPRVTTLQVRVAGQVLAEVPLAPGERRDATVVVPASLLRDGRLEVALVTPPPPRRSDVGQAGFAVQAVGLEPA